MTETGREVWTPDRPSESPFLWRRGRRPRVTAPASAGFAAALRREREARRLSQGRLGALARLDRSYLSRLEAGLRTPTRECVESLARAFGMEGAARDEFFATGGFSPLDPDFARIGEPVVADLLSILADESIDAAYRDGLRAVVARLVEMARIVRDAAVGRYDAPGRTNGPEGGS